MIKLILNLTLFLRDAKAQAMKIMFGYSKKLTMVEKVGRTGSCFMGW